MSSLSLLRPAPLLGLLALSLLLALSAPARAATLSVTSTADDGGPNELRQVLAAAAAGDTIVFAPGVTGTITLTQGTLTVSQPVTIQGPGAARLAVDGGHAVTVFQISNTSGTAALSGLTVQNGNATTPDPFNPNYSVCAGGVFVSAGADVALTSCTLTGNSAYSEYGANGGGLCTAGTATLTSCTLAGNSAYGFGGGAANENGALTLTDCLLSGNSNSGGSGGGIDNEYGLLTMTGCLLSGNSAGYYGGGLYVGSGSATVTGCTLTGNSAPGGAGGGLTFGGSSLTLTDDILYGDNGGEAHSFNGPNTVSASFCDIGETLGGDGVADNGGNVNEDPAFLAPAEGDYRLAANSPLAGAGTPVAGNEYDADGRLRPNPPAIGAYEPAAGTLSGQGRNVSAGAGVPLTVYVATFTDPNPSPTFPTVLINWGDGTALDTTTGAVYASGTSGTGYAVAGTHTYASDGQYTVTVDVHDGAGYAGVFTGTANVSDAPAAPTSLTATPTQAHVVLTWNASATPGVVYYVYRGTSSGSETKLISPALSGLTFTDKTPDYNGTTDYYVVKASKSGVLGAASPEASATASNVLPLAPTGLTAAVGNGTATLTWKAPAAKGAGQVTSYSVYRGTAAGQENFAHPVYTGSALTFTDTGLSDGAAYFYVVKATNTAGEGPASNEASATPVAASTLTATPGKAGSGKITLTYTAAAGATRYTLYRSVNSDGSGATQIYAYNKPGTFTDTGRTPGTTYYYKVVASNAGGSTPSALVSALNPLPFAGHYTGTYVNASSTDRGTFTLDIDGSGNITGTLTDTTHGVSGPATGTIDANGNATISVAYPNGTYTDVGTLSYVSGNTYTASVSEYYNGNQIDSDTLTLTKS